MEQFVAYGLAIKEKMGITDKQGGGIVMRFCKIYPFTKLIKIVEKAQSYGWWEKNPTAAFMKAIGEVNRAEKEGDI